MRTQKNAPTQHTFRSPIRDACKVTFGQTFAIGLIAGLVSAGIIEFFEFLGWIQIDFEIFFGSFWTREISEMSWWIGFGYHLVISAFIAQIYAFLFRSAHRSGAPVGFAMGLIHWLLAGLGTGFVSMIHPLIPGQIVGPGLFVLGDGFGAAVTYFVAHLAYGGTVGFLFDRVAICDEYPVPLSMRDGFDTHENALG